MPTATQVGELQDASNEVARRVGDDILTGPVLGAAPTLPAIADRDASAVGDHLFYELSEDTVYTANAGWSGALLFSALGNDQTARLVSSGSISAADTVDDWRNVIYAALAHDRASSHALETGFHDFVYSTPMFRADVATALESAAFSGRITIFLDSLTSQEIAGTAFDVVVSLGAERTLALIESAQAQEPVEFWGLDPRQMAHDVFSAYGDSGQNISLNYINPRDLRHLGVDGSGSAQLDARAALQALTPFSLESSGSSSLLSLSDAWLRDRADMLTARLAFDQAQLPYTTGSVRSPEISGDVAFVDLSSGMSLSVQNSLLVPSFKYVIFGGHTAESIEGGGNDDQLYGADGDDQLDGLEGDDILDGGAGNDTYSISSGADTVIDFDGQGSVLISGVQLVGGTRVGAGGWKSADGRFTYKMLGGSGSTDLRVVDSLSDVSVLMPDFVSGDLGIVLAQADQITPSPATFAPTDTAISGIRDYYASGSPLGDFIESGLQNDYATPGNGADILFLGEESDRTLSGQGGDAVFGEGGNDYLRSGGVYGSPEDDFDIVSGGLGTDMIYGGIGDDVLIGETVGADISSDESGPGEWILGAAGDDSLSGSTRSDLLFGGSGSDDIAGGGADDVILGDGALDFSFVASVQAWTGFGAAEHNWNGAFWTSRSATAQNPVSNVIQPVSRFEWVALTDGDDFSIQFSTPPNSGNQVRLESPGGGDFIRGGSGNDWVAGQSGGDTLHGGPGNDVLWGEDFVALPAGETGGIDWIEGGAGADRIFGGTGGDWLLGQDGDDVVYGDGPLAVAGDDHLEGNGGNDILYGDGGDDVVSGDSGADELVGGEGDDLLDGGEDMDVLYGEADNDILLGGGGDDALDGGPGSDDLRGGQGDDTVNGGTGNDSIHLDEGADVLSGGDGDDQYFVDYTTSGTHQITETSGMDSVIFGEGIQAARLSADSVAGDLVLRKGQTLEITITGGAGGTAVESFVFADGITRSAGELLAPVGGPTAGSDRLEGTESADIISGGTGDDVIFGFDGEDTLNGNDGNDIIDGMAAADFLYGGAGADKLYGSDGGDLLHGGAGDDFLAGGQGSDALYGEDDNDELTGGIGDDELYGGNGEDVLVGGPGLNQLVGGAGDDVYHFEIGDSAGVTSSISDSGYSLIRFGHGINREDLHVTGLGVSSTKTIVFGNSAVRVFSGVNHAVEVNFQGGKTVSLESLVSQGSYGAVASDAEMPHDPLVIAALIVRAMSRLFEG